MPAWVTVSSTSTLKASFATSCDSLFGSDCFSSQPSACVRRAGSRAACSGCCDADRAFHPLPRSQDPSSQQHRCTSTCAGCKRGQPRVLAMQAAGEAALAASPQADMDEGRPSSPWPATSAAYAWPRKARDLLRILASARAAALASPFPACCQELSCAAPPLRPALPAGHCACRCCCDELLRD